MRFKKPWPFSQKLFCCRPPKTAFQANKPPSPAAAAPSLLRPVNRITRAAGTLSRKLHSGRIIGRKQGKEAWIII